MTDESFKIKSLSGLLAENNFARKQELLKQNLYAFMLRLLEENKNLVERLADCQQGYNSISQESRSERNHKNECRKELEELKIKVNALTVENEALKTMTGNPPEEKVLDAVLKKHLKKSARKKTK